MPASRRAPTVASCRSARIDVTGAHVVLASSHARRRCESSRFGVVLAILGLLTQIAGSGLHPLFPIRSTNGVAKLAIAHALCLANGHTAPRPPAPADKAPKADNDLAGCCVWHGVASAVLTPAALAQPVAFVASRLAYTAPPAEIPTCLPGTVRARAPPAR